MNILEDYQKKLREQDMLKKMFILLIKLKFSYN